MGLVKAITSSMRHKGFTFTDEQVSALFTALKTRGFVILTGQPGTGKTRLAYELTATLVPADSDHLLFEPVSAGWHDGSSLLGYWNPVTDTYHGTRFLHLVLAALRDYQKNKERAMPRFVILDEMNLARVEHYLAEYLSVAESGAIADGAEEGLTIGEVPLHERHSSAQTPDGFLVPQRLRLPPNLYIIGTTNVGETTSPISAKVIDRAFVLELGNLTTEPYLNPPEGDGLITDEVRAQLLTDFTRHGRFTRLAKREITELSKTMPQSVKAILQLHAKLQADGFESGYRSLDDIIAFTHEFVTSKVTDAPEKIALDLAVLMKVLPRIHGTARNVTPILDTILRWAGPGGATQRRYPRTYAKAAAMAKQLEADGYTSFYV